MKKHREIKIGIISVTALFLLFWGINFLKGKNLFTNHSVFYTIVDETKGLSNSNLVTLNGIRIGQVSRVFFHPDGSGRIVVRGLIADRSINIPNNSLALLRQPSLVSEMEIAIQLGDSPIPLQSGDTIPSAYVASVTEGLTDQVFPILQRVEGLAAQLDSVFVSVNKILDTKTIESISKSLENISLITQSLVNNSQRIDGIMADGERIVEELKKSSVEVTKAVNNFSTISTELAQANLGKILEEASNSLKSLNGFLEKVQSSSGSLNLLLEDKGLYLNLKNSTKQLELLLEDVRMNPTRYINFSIF